MDQGCLLLSTPNNTPITRAHPPRRPIGALGNSTFPRGAGSDWLKCLSVKWASRKDAAGVLGTRSPEQRRSNLPYKQDVFPPLGKRVGGGGGGAKAHPNLGAPPERSGPSAESGNPSTSRCRCSCKHVSLHVCFPFSLTVAIMGCCLQKFCRPLTPHPPFPRHPCPYSVFFLFLLLVSTAYCAQAYFPFIALHVGQVMLYQHVPFSTNAALPL